MQWTELNKIEYKLSLALIAYDAVAGRFFLIELVLKKSAWPFIFGHADFYQSIYIPLHNLAHLYSIKGHSQLVIQTA